MLNRRHAKARRRESSDSISAGLFCFLTVSRCLLSMALHWVRQKFLAVVPPPAETFGFDYLPGVIPMGI